MKKIEARQLLAEVTKWVLQKTEGNPSYDVILGSFNVDENNGDAFAVPVSFDALTAHPDWEGSTKDKDVASKIRAIQAKMDEFLCPQRMSVYLTHEDGYCFLILGTEQADVVRKWKKGGRPQGVTLSFDNPASTAEGFPCFKEGELVKLSASSPLKGWVYLFCIDADRTITPVYPAEGQESELSISQNSVKYLSDEINALIRKKSPFTKTQPLKFTGQAAGKERIVAVVTEKPVPMTIAHLKRRIPLPLLYSHEQISRGVGESQTDSTCDFNSLRLNQMAIGTLDYYYQA